MVSPNILALLAVCVVALSRKCHVAGLDDIDMSTCNSEKGCIVFPSTCRDTSDCLHIVTYRVSPSDPENKVRFEMWSKLTSSDGKAIDYVAFALSNSPDLVMTNSSVLACVYNPATGFISAFLNYNRDSPPPKTSIPLPDGLSKVGLDELVLTRDSTAGALYCQIDRAIKPTEAQMGYAFPLDMPWTTAIAAGPANEANGNVRKHVNRLKVNGLVTLTDFKPKTPTVSISLEGCGSAKGCLKFPETCTSTSDCAHIVTWQPSPIDSANKVRFEMWTTLKTSDQQVDYVAFAQAADPNSVMTNSSVLVCGHHPGTGTVSAFLTYNRKGPSSSTVLPDGLSKVGIEEISLVRDSVQYCLVDRAIKPTEAQSGLAFPLNQPWTLGISAGPMNETTGLLRKHWNRLRQPGLVTLTDYPLKQETTPQPTTTAPPAPTVDLTTCDKTKGCITFPSGCAKTGNCEHIVTWQPSPIDTNNKVRFEMWTNLETNSQPVDYIAFALAADPDSVMVNSSVLVCAHSPSNGQVSAFLTYNRKGPSSSTVLPDGLSKVGIDEISLVRQGGVQFCLVDRAIKPTEAQSGLAFPLDQPWTLGIAAGATNETTGLLRKHYNRLRQAGLVTLTDFSHAQTTKNPDQTSTKPSVSPVIDLSSCDKSKGCIVNPPGCSSSDTCSQIITWTVRPEDPDYVRFEMSTSTNYRAANNDYIAFALAATKTSFMSNASVLVCGRKGSDPIPIAYLSHNEDGESVPLRADLYQVGLKGVQFEAQGSHLFCVVDRAINAPSTQQAGLVFALNQLWYPAWAVGENDPGSGLVGYHEDTKQPYETQVNCTDARSPSAPTIDKDLYRKLHAVLMMAGWMICVACSILTPRYLRDHWTTKDYCGLQLWFVIHRALMLIGIACVIVGFALILVINDYLIVDPGPTYPAQLHPYFGVAAVSILFLNPLVSLFRCPPGSKHRPIFNWIHGLLGGLGFLLAMANIIIGAIMSHTYTGSYTVYAVITWAALHVFVEILYLVIAFTCKTTPGTANNIPLKPMPSIDVIRNSDASLPSLRQGTMVIETAPISDRRKKPISYLASTWLFVIYFILTIALTIAASVLQFVKV